MQITQKMSDFFEIRTKYHIKLVKKYMSKIYNSNSIKYKELKDRIKIHDQSKFKEPELTPYIIITWSYFCRDHDIPFELTDMEKELTRFATYHHCKSNRHHPEFHDDTTTIESISLVNRDKPSEIVDGRKMSEIDIAEMLADWMAVSEERKTSPLEWANNNINQRWIFTKEQTHHIYLLINTFWRY